MKNSKKIIRIVFRLLIFLIILILVNILLSKVLIRKDEYSKYNEFYSENEKFDCLFFGSSRMLDAAMPMEIWKEYGIRTYNMGQHTEWVARNYWSILNAIQYNKPTTVVLDLSLFAGKYRFSGDESEEDKAYLHNMLDHMPLSITKYKAITEMLPASLRAEYMFPLIKYHSRWYDINISDFTGESSPTKGGELRFSLNEAETPIYDTNELSEYFRAEDILLDRIVKLCKENDIDLVFVILPSPSATSFTTYNSFEQYAKEENIPVLNMIKMTDVFNYGTDFADSSHVNVAGAKKVSHVLGDYLSDKPVIEVDNKTILNWNKKLEDYTEYKNLNIIYRINDPKISLMQIVSDSEYSCKIVVRNQDILQYLDIENFICEMGEQLLIETNENADSDYYIIIYGKSGFSTDCYGNMDENGNMVYFLK